MTSRVARRLLRAAAFAATLGGFACETPAFAQFFGYGGGAFGGPPPVFGGYPGYGPPPGYGRFGGPFGRRAGAPFASRRAIAGLLAGRGLRLEGPLDFEGPNIVAIGVDPAGRARRFVIDPYEGAVLGARPLPRMAARPDGSGDAGLREDAPPPPAAALSSRPKSPAEPKDEPPVWRGEPGLASTPPHGAKAAPAVAEPAPDKKNPPPLPAQEASAAPAHAAIAPAPQGEAVTAAPTGELEPPRPASGG
ncbi:MAG TPA: hypothetical protein VMJ31_04880 [Methylocystis sp.]|nr:hypothetical protein [Methylocystis sp.]